MVASAWLQTALRELLAISQGNLTTTFDMLAQLEMDSETSMPLDDFAEAEAPEFDQARPLYQSPDLICS